MELRGIEDRAGDMKSYADHLREQRESSMVTGEVEKYEYKPVQIPKKINSLPSYLSLPERHDQVLASKKDLT